MKDLIPKGATRVQVTDEVGKLVWRKPQDLRDTDTIKFNPNTGEPYVMYGSPESQHRARVHPLRQLQQPRTRSFLLLRVERKTCLIKMRLSLASLLLSQPIYSLKLLRGLQRSQRVSTLSD